MAQTTVVHIGDTHLGKRQYESDLRRDDLPKAFERAIDVAVERDVDAVAHTGDLFDDPRSTLPTVTRCADGLATLREHEIPFYGIVGNQDRRNDEQWLDLFRRPNEVNRLGREPRVVGDTALYGIDAVRLADWQRTDFTLERPPAGVDCTILCMHELLEPPGDDLTADYPVEDVLDRVDIDLDGFALGGFHQPKSARVDGTDIWYAGATGQFGTDEAAAGVVQLLEIVDGTITRRQLELETGPFVAPTTPIGRGDGVPGVRDVFDRCDLTDLIAKIALGLEVGAVATDEVAQMANDADGAVVDVEDDRGHVARSVDERAGRSFQTRNATETAVLLDFRRRSGRGTHPAERNAAEAARGDGSTETDEFEHDEEPEHDEERTEYMTEEREELIQERDRLAAELSELGAAIDDVQTEIEAIDDDLVAAVRGRDTAAEAFLPDDRLPESVSDETRDAIASYLDTLAEKRDVRSEQVTMKNASLDVETKNAADAREDIDETEAVVERLDDRTDEAESIVHDARDELDAARSRFADDLTGLAGRLATFDIGLYRGTLGVVIDDRIPERMSELQASIESARSRVAELSARASERAEERDKLQSIDGGGSCPTCHQNVGPERTESEVKAIEEEITQIERKLGAAKQNRDELIAGKEELVDLRDRAIALRRFRSETVAGAKGRVEDRQENFEDLQADLEEERSELAEVRDERDEADTAIATLETEIDGLEADIDKLQAKANQGETSSQAFDVVDELQRQLEERTDELEGLQAAYDEKEVERAALDAEIEDLTGDE